MALCRLARFPVHAGRIATGIRTLMASANTFDIVDRKYIYIRLPLPFFALSFSPTPLPSSSRHIRGWGVGILPSYVY